MTVQQVYENIMRDALSVYSAEGLKEKLESGKTLKIKMGADPSRPDLHLGHSALGYEQAQRDREDQREEEDPERKLEALKQLNQCRLYITHINNPASST